MPVTTLHAHCMPSHCANNVTHPAVGVTFVCTRGWEVTRYFSAIHIAAARRSCRAGFKPWRELKQKLCPSPSWIRVGKSRCGVSAAMITKTTVCKPEAPTSNYCWKSAFQFWYYWFKENRNCWSISWRCYTVYSGGYLQIFERNFIPSALGIKLLIEGTLYLRFTLVICGLGFMSASIALGSASWGRG